MNKLLVTLTGVAGLTLSLGATAGTFNINVNGAQTDIATSACTLLSEDVKINTSKSVEGGYDCNTDTAIIAVAMCHPNGKKFNTTGNLVFVGNSAGGAVAPANTSPTDACTASVAEGVAQTAAAGSGS